MKPLHLVVLFFVLLCHSGCTTLRTAPEPLPQLPDPVEYAQAALTIPQQASQAGIARITIKVQNTSQGYKTVYACMYPDVLRLEVLGLFNQPGLYISANRQTGITLYVPSKNAWYRGPATAESMRRISGIRLNPFDIVKIIHGSPPGPDPTQADITCTQNNGSYQCRLEKEGSVQDIWINPLTGSITRSRLFENSLATHDIHYQDFRRHDERYIPEKIKVSFERYATSLEIKLQNPMTTPLETKQLQLQAPIGTVFLPLNTFFEAQ